MNSLSRIHSFKNACKGIFLLLKSQKNARIHALASLIIIITGFGFGITRIEWGLLVLTMAAVWIAEAFNSTLEFLADACSPDFNPLIGRAKDLAAGAVLISAIGAIVVGIVIFFPYFLKLSL